MTGEEYVGRLKVLRNELERIRGLMDEQAKYVESGIASYSQSGVEQNLNKKVSDDLENVIGRFKKLEDDFKAQIERSLSALKNEHT